MAKESEWPQTVKKCFVDVNWPKWRNALLHEWTKFMVDFNAASIISQREKNEYLKSAEFKGLIPMRWVNVVKFMGNRFKSRLVVAQNTHRYDIDDNFSPTLSLETFRLLCCIACIKDARIEQADVLGAYLTVRLDPKERPILVMLPSGLKEMGIKVGSKGEMKWTDHEGKTHVLQTDDHGPPVAMKLNAGCYGLQRASQYFINSFFDFLKSEPLHYKQSSIDPCLFYRKDDDENFVYAGVYSDNIIIISKGERLRTEFMIAFNTKYKESPDSEFGQDGDCTFLSLLVHSEKIDDCRTVSLSSPKLMESLRKALKDRRHVKISESCEDTFFPQKVKSPIPNRDDVLEPVTDGNPLVPKEIFDCRSVLGIILWIVLAYRFDGLFETALLSRLLHSKKTLKV